MGVYIEAIIDNNIFENDFEFTIKKLCKYLKKELHLYGEFNNFEYPKDENGYLIIQLYDKSTINEDTINNPDLNIYINDKLYKLDCYISKYYILFGGFEGKWYNFEHYLEGKGNEFYNDKINDIIHFGKLFKSTEMIIFGDDYYDDEIENELLNGKKINEIIKNNEYNIVTNIPINDEKSPHIYYKKIENKIDLEYDEWIKYFIKKTGHCT